jgi:hypothetical protein
LHVMRQQCFRSIAGFNVWVEARPAGFLNIPYNPETAYDGVGWAGWRHWLGAGTQGCVTQQDWLALYGDDEEAETRYDYPDDYPWGPHGPDAPPRLDYSRHKCGELAKLSAHNTLGTREEAQN